MSRARPQQQALKSPRLSSAGSCLAHLLHLVTAPPGTRGLQAVRCGKRELKTRAGAPTSSRPQAGSDALFPHSYWSELGLRAPLPARCGGLFTCHHVRPGCPGMSGRELGKSDATHLTPSGSLTSLGFQESDAAFFSLHFIIIFHLPATLSLHPPHPQQTVRFFRSGLACRRCSIHVCRASK